MAQGQGRRDNPENVHLVMPLDGVILAKLPKEGTLFGGLHPVGTQVSQLAKDLTEQGGVKFTGPQVSGRMNTLAVLGYVTPVTVQPLGKGRGWQRTSAGTDFLREQGIEIKE